jgi:hypothetical protein
MLSAWRNEPGPLSFVLVTVMVSALASTVSVQSTTAAMAADPKYDVVLIFIRYVNYRILCFGDPCLDKRLLFGGRKAESNKIKGFIGFIAENAFPSIPMHHHVVKHPAILDLNRSRRGSLLNPRPDRCQNLLTDPILLFPIPRLT